MRLFAANFTGLEVDEKTATDAALICDHKKLVARILETTQRFRNSIENLDRFRIGAILYLAHDGSVPIKKNGRLVFRVFLKRR